MDENTQKPYYYNKVTKMTSWNKPIDFDGPVGEDNKEHGWVKFTDQTTKKPYYYNKDTKVTTWDMPDELLRCNGETARKAWKIGDVCEAMHPETASYHAAVIKKIKRSRRQPGLVLYDVLFEDLGTVVSLQRTQLR